MVIASEGWTVEYADEPQLRPDAIGDFADTRICQACKGDVLVVRPGCEGDAYYSASHEIAEVRHGFEHRSVTWIEQSNILGRWCKDLARAAVKLSGDEGSERGELLHEAIDVG